MHLTLCNAAGRDAQVAADSVKIPVRIRRLDRDGRQCQSVRFLKGTLDRNYAALLRRAPGADAAGLAETLIAGDPELDFEQVGRFLRPGESQRVWVNPAGQVVHAIARQEIVRNPDGSEKQRRPHAIAAANLHLPLGWSGKLIPKAEAVKKFVFGGKRQICHVNGLTYDFLYAIARELEEKQALLLVGAGSKGNQPLILRRGALPYRGFLEGRTKADQYCLVLHLSNLELKTPEPQINTDERR
jgi:hypothetical protein